MPVRLLSSSVLKWPDAQTVDRAVRQWAAKVVRSRTDVLRIGYFGSYARGDWGVGSDLDLVILVVGLLAIWFRGRAARGTSTATPSAEPEAPLDSMERTAK